MALVNTSTMARCRASASSGAASSRLSHPAKASRAVVRLGLSPGSSRCRAGTGSASRCAASAVTSSAWPVARQPLHAQLAHSFHDGGADAERRDPAGGRAGGRVGGGRGELGHPLGEGLARPFDEAVAVQQDQLARGERAGRQDGRRAGAQRSGPGARQVPGRPVGADDQRRGMPAGGVAQLPADRVEHRQGERGGPQGRHPGGEGVGSLQHAPEVGLRGQEFGQHRAQLPHRRRGGDPVPHHVADDQRDAAVGQRDRVEPVAARRLLMPGHQVPGRDPGPRQHRQGGGQQRLLHFRHDPAHAASYVLAAGSPTPVRRAKRVPLAAIPQLAHGARRKRVPGR